MKHNLTQLIFQELLDLNIGGSGSKVSILVMVGYELNKNSENVISDIDILASTTVKMYHYPGFSQSISLPGVPKLFFILKNSNFPQCRMLNVETKHVQFSKDRIGF